MPKSKAPKAEKLIRIWTTADELLALHFAINNDPGSDEQSLLTIKYEGLGGAYPKSKKIRWRDQFTIDFNAKDDFALSGSVVPYQSVMIDGQESIALVASLDFGRPGAPNQFCGVLVHCPVKQSG